MGVSAHAFGGVDVKSPRDGVTGLMGCWAGYTSPEI